MQTHRSLEDAGFCSLFKYKLVNFLDQSSVWTKDERLALREFFDELLEQQFNTDENIGYLIEAALSLGLSANHICSKWQSKEALLIKQLYGCYRHFDCQMTGTPASPRGLYYDNKEQIELLLNLKYAQLSNQAIADLELCLDSGDASCRN